MYCESKFWDIALIGEKANYGPRVFVSRSVVRIFLEGSRNIPTTFDGTKTNDERILIVVYTGTLPVGIVRQLSSSSAPSDSEIGAIQSRRRGDVWGTIWPSIRPFTDVTAQTVIMRSTKIRDVSLVNASP